MDEAGERNAGCSGRSTSYYASSRVRRRKSHGRKIPTNQGVVGSNPAGRATFNDLAAKTKSSFLLWDRCGTTYPPVRADLTEFKHFAAETKSSFIVVGPCGICFCTSAFAVGDA